MKRDELRQNHIESEGDNGNAGISFDAGWDACEQSYIDKEVPEKVTPGFYSTQVQWVIDEELPTIYSVPQSGIYTVTSGDTSVTKQLGEGCQHCVNLSLDLCQKEEKIAELEYKLKIATDLLENMSSSFTDTNNDIYTVLKRLRK